MQAIRRLSACAVLILFAAASVRAAAPVRPAARDPLAEGFANPPVSAQPHTWWHWINDNISREGITADLEAMHRAGIGGAQIFNVDVGIPSGKVKFMTPEYRQMVKHAVSEAGRLGIEICLHNCAGWSSSGGPWITPEYAMQVVTWSEKPAHGPARFSNELQQPRTRLSYYRDIAVLAVRKPSSETDTQKLRIANLGPKAAFDRGDRIAPDTGPTPAGMATPLDGVVDLTSHYRDGRLEWDVPAGDWTILRIGHTPTGVDNHPATREGNGLEVDKLSREALDVHWNGMMAKIIADVGPLAGKALNNSLIDSYEVGSQNWTPKFREEFRKRRGYDLLPFLPVMAGGHVVGDLRTSERFLWDLRRTVADLFADNYFGYFRELCHQHGLKFSTEPYGSGSFDDLEVGGMADIPMGEFWLGGGTLETTKEAASAGHTNGRTVIGAESFTADDNRGRFIEEPYGMKALGDLAFCNGINRYIFHRYALQPWMNVKPGMTMGPWGTHFERTETWWDQGAAWLKYVARCQYLLQSGRFAADAVYFYGEDGPNTLPYRPGLRPAIPAGYDYDGCDATVVLNRMSVRDGRIVLPDGVSYRVLVLPESPYMTPRTLRRMRDLVSAGATVLGTRPMYSPSLTDQPRADEEVGRLADELWGAGAATASGEHTLGRGRVVWGKTLADVFASLNYRPDFEPAGSGAQARLIYIHRTVDDAEVYFVSNQRYRSEDAECTFRVADRVPELWHPDTGEMAAAPVFTERDGRTTVPLHFDPAGSVFVVFRRPSARQAHFVSLARTGAMAPEQPAPRVEIQHAYYEPANGLAGGADVTEKVRAMVAAGELEIPATNQAFGDPAYMVVKRLRIEYMLDGKPMRKIAGENESITLAGLPGSVAPPAFDVATGRSGGVQLEPWEGGEYQLRTAGGRTRRISAKAADTLPLEGGWDLRFPPNWGAPRQVHLDRLVSWSDHPDAGVHYFSGTAEYTREFDVPRGLVGSGRAVRLDLGDVRNFAEVTLNGRDLGVLWKAPFSVDVTDAVKPGRNQLSVRVTNLWPNRLIGDAQQDPDQRLGPVRSLPEWLQEGKPVPPGRYTFVTWHFYDKNSPLLPSGLIGPVTLRSVKKVTVNL